MDLLAGAHTVQTLTHCVDREGFLIDRDQRKMTQIQFSERYMCISFQDMSIKIINNPGRII